MTTLKELIDYNIKVREETSDVAGIKSRRIVAELLLFASMDAMQPLPADQAAWMEKQVRKQLKYFMFDTAYGGMKRKLMDIRRALPWDATEAIDAWDDLYGMMTE